MPERIKTFNRHFESQKIKTHEPAAAKADKAFYQSARWRKCRRMKLQKNPVCECIDRCKQPAQEVHHILSRKDRPDLQLDLDNLQSLTTSCHSKITRKDQLKRNSSN